MTVMPVAIQGWRDFQRSSRPFKAPSRPLTAVRRMLLLVAVASGLSAISATPASAHVQGLFGINLTESTTTHPSDPLYVDGTRTQQQWRFDGGSNYKGTVMSFNNFYSLGTYANSSYSAYDNTYHGLGSWLAGSWIVLRGRTHSGVGNMTNGYGYALF